MKKEARELEKSIASFKRRVRDQLKRERRGMKEIAELTGVSYVTIWSFRNGKDIRIENVIAIARVL